ncbi:MAG: hypothetical protein DA443_02920 [Bacteroidetes bacterium]|nr:MAG: hypothetical protein DA443_02920 [Bacteroidota bacterium]
MRIENADAGCVLPRTIEHRIVELYDGCYNVLCDYFTDWAPDGKIDAYSDENEQGARKKSVDPIV